MAVAQAAVQAPIVDEIARAQAASRRDFLLKFILFGIIVSITFGIGLITYFWLLWDAKRQELWDKMVGTIVVDDRQGLLR